MSTIRAVTVYCSSSSAVDEAYFAAAHELGRALAGAGWTLVYGGNNVGLMGTIAQSTRAAGGRVVGITPQLMVDKKVHDPLCDELIVTATMRERKQLLEDRGDALLALPGGIGTYEELFEVLVAKQLGYHNKPIVLLNVDRFFSPLLAMLDAGIERRFIKPAARSMLFVTDDVEAAMQYLRGYVPVTVEQKWFSFAPPSAIE